MIRIDLYANGSDYRVRLHEHAAGADEACNDACDEETVERTYCQRGDGPGEVRAQVVIAMLAALKPYGHAEFLQMLGERPRLW